MLIQQLESDLSSSLNSLLLWHQISIQNKVNIVSRTFSQHSLNIEEKGNLFDVVEHYIREQTLDSFEVGPVF